MGFLPYLGPSHQRKTLTLPGEVRALEAESLPILGPETQEFPRERFSGASPPDSARPSIEARKTGDSPVVTVYWTGA